MLVPMLVVRGDTVSDLNVVSDAMIISRLDPERAMARSANSSMYRARDIFCALHPH